MKDPKTVLSVIATIFVGLCAVILTWKGDVTHALIFGAMLMPSVSNIVPTSTITSSLVKAAGPLAVAALVIAGCAQFLPALSSTVDDTKAQIACAADASTYEEGEACVCAVRRQYPAGPQCDAGADASKDADHE